MKVGFAGAGNMAAALARGWALEGGPKAMLFADAGSGRAARLADEVGGEHRATLAELAADSDLIVLAVKPAALEDASAPLRGFAGPIVSVLGGTSLERLEAALPGVTLLRTMPNVAVEVGRGVICHAPPADRKSVLEGLSMLGRIGTLVELPESSLDAATAVMGCAPAYLALACEALIEGGADAGLDDDLALKLVSEMAAGTGELLLSRSPAAIASAVASPGGSTEAGLDALRADDVGSSFKRAVVASLERMAGTR